MINSRFAPATSRLPVITPADAHSRGLFWPECRLSLANGDAHLPEGAVALVKKVGRRMDGIPVDRDALGENAHMTLKFEEN